MAQKQFDMHFKCSDLEARNAVLEAENQALKEKVSDLAFETMLLRDISGFDEDEKKTKLSQLSSKVTMKKTPKSRV